LEKILEIPSFLDEEWWDFLKLPEKKLTSAYGSNAGETPSSLFCPLPPNSMFNINIFQAGNVRLVAVPYAPEDKPKPQAVSCIVALKSHKVLEKYNSRRMKCSAEAGWRKIKWREISEL
jgi:hypothetical protein